MYWESIWDSFVERLTPTLTWLNNLKNKELEKVTISNQTCEDIKKWLEVDLLNWINIHNKEEFDSIMWLLVKHWIIKNAPKFSDLKNPLWNNITFLGMFWKNIKVNWKEVILSLRKEQNSSKISIYAIQETFVKYNIFPRTWFINENWEFEYNPDTNIYKYDDKISPSLNSGNISKYIWECSTPKTKNPKKEKPKEEEKPDLEYKIKHGDYLWKIISEKYWLDKVKDKNAIWQIMKMIRNDERNAKAINKNNVDIIYTWKTLYLPTSIKLPQWKWKEEKEIKITEKAK